MRAELVAIHTALDTFVSHEWIGIFTDSLFSLQAIRHHRTNPSTGGAMHYHHHMLLLDSITDPLETRKSESFCTTLHNIRAHTNIRGNDLADAATKVVVTHFDTLPSPHTLRVDLRETTPRPTRWVMHTAKLPPPDPALSTGTNCATLRRPWWSVLEADRLQFHAFTAAQAKSLRCANT